MKHILEYYPDELTEKIKKLGGKSFRSKQIINWIYNKNIIDFDEMTSLSKDFRYKLMKNIPVNLPKIINKEFSSDGTTKFLLELYDRLNIEMVIIPNENKNTLCISSQVGCKRNCKFCATAQIGFKRNLAIYEIIAQIFLAKSFLKNSKLTNIVFMGMGEPLDNYDNVFKAVKLLQNDMMFSFSPRRITLSTCGIIPGINKLGVSGLKLKLAISLNSAINEKRDYLMPINKQYPLEQLKKAVKEFTYLNPYRVTFEYIMIPEFNMSSLDVKSLIRFAGDLSCKINLIPWNPVKKLEFRAPDSNEISNFQKKLMKIDKAVTLRNSRGTDINGACGQLAGKYLALNNS